MGELVKFLGMRPDVSALHAQSHVFVLPSLWEGLPLAVLEAGSSAMPVIASPVGALPWLLDQERGYLTEPDDLAGSMVAALLDYDDALARGHRLFKLVRDEFNDATCLRRHHRLYQSIRTDDAVDHDSQARFSQD